MVLQTGAAPIAAAPQRLVYDGRLGELYGIFFINLLLGIITLGIYRFWGRTRYRRYLWSHTSYDGDRFEYTGTGGELFRGFVIAIAILILFMAIVLGTQAVLLPQHSGLVVAIVLPIYALLLLAFFAARYTALRYRLTRTQWRGIRGGLSGSALNFALRSIGYGILSGLTLYQFIPFATVRLWRYRLRNLFFGTAQAQFQGRGRDLYWRYLGAFLLVFMAGVFVAVVFFLVMRGDIMDVTAKFGDHAQLSNPETGDRIPPPMDPEVQSSLNRITIGAVVAYLGWGLLGLFAFLWYWAFSMRYITGGTSLAGLQFQSTATAGRLAGLMIGNLLLMVVTLGIGYPIVLQRIWRFGADNFLIHGQLDATVIEQSRLLRPKLGEGWLEVLDPGII